MSDSDAQQPQDFSAFEGTRPGQRAPALRYRCARRVARRARRWLRRAARPSSSSRAASRIPTFKLITPARSYVMRSKPGPAAKLLPSAHAIEREYRVMDALAATDVPVAQMFALCEDESVIGRAFYVMEFVEGRVLWDQSLPGMTPAERGAIYDEMNRVIAALHSVDVDAIGLADYGKPGNYFERQIGRWSKQYEASETEPIEAMDRLIDWLPKHIPRGRRGERTRVDRPRRLSPRQPHLPSDRAARARRARLGTVDARRSARRFRLSLHGVARRSVAVSRHRADSTGPRSASPTKRPMSRGIASAPASRSKATGISISPTTCSASPRSCRGS